MRKITTLVVIFILISHLNALSAEKKFTDLWKLCNPNTGLGTLYLRGQSPFQLLRLSLFPDDPSTIPEGYVEVKETISWTNRWGFAEFKYIVDAEIIRASTKVTYGYTDNLQFSLEVPACYRFGGILDGVIMNFHDNVGISQAKRDDFPKDRFLIEFNRRDGSIFRLDQYNKKFAVEDIVFSTKYKVSCGSVDKPAIALTSNVKFPVGDADELFGSSGVDFGETFSISKGYGDFYLYGALGVTYFGGNKIAGIKMRPYQFTIFGAVEYKPYENLSFLFQHLSNSPAAKEFYAFSKFTHEVTFGMKWQLSESLVFELGVIENILNYDNSPDFGIHAGLSYRFQ